MATELYDITVPPLLRSLANLSAILEKGRAFAAETGLDPDQLLQSRLIDDMNPLTSQVQRASDAAKGVAVRLAGHEPTSMADEETTFEQLQDRIARTVEVLKAIRPEEMNGTEDTDVVITTPRGSFEFTGRSYVLGFVLPNVHFHVTTAYGLLRKAGVPLGKLDYLGRLS